MGELLSWYLAPWRKIGRGPFNTILLAVSVPGFIFSVMGWGSGAGGLGSVFSSVMDLGQQFQHGDGAMTAAANNLLGMSGSSSAPAAAPVASSFTWGNVGNWVNNLLWLACIPIAQMRLRDLGYPNGGIGQIIWLILLFVGTVVDILYTVGVPGLDSADTWTSVIGFVVLAVLCGKSAPQKDRGEEHFIYTPPAGTDPHGPAKGTGEPKQW